MSSERMLAPGPFTADQLRDKDPYELSNGHAVLCLPTGARGARTNLTGAAVLDSDPAVTQAGIDAGYSPVAGTLRAPDVSVGNVPDTPGWIAGVPPLAVEFADVGQDEEKLSEKIADLLQHGTRHVWVVRLVGPRRVEVHEPGVEPRVVGDGGVLLAPDVLKNPVPVAALFDREAAHEVTLRNLLQRRGYASLDEVRVEGRVEGRVEADANAVLLVLDARGLAVSDEQRAQIGSCRDAERLESWIRAAAVAASSDELFR